MPDLVYRVAGRTLNAFHRDRTRRRGIIGPIRSGKSTACCWEVPIKALGQKPWLGSRLSKWVIIRDTYGDLERTTLATWKMQFGSRWGYPVGRKAGIVHEIREELPDGTFLECDVIFLALDHPDDVNKLLSFELTGAYVNEARSTNFAIVETLDDRVGQFPPKSMGGCDWFGWWFDSNPPDDAHWIYRLREEEKPEGWSIYKQPGGIIQDELDRWIPNPEAENVSNLNAGAQYYIDNMPGKTEQHVKVMYGGRYGYLVDGQLVYHEFNEDVHVAKADLDYIKGSCIYVGIDGGKTPAAAFMQRLPNRRWLMLDELVARKIGCDAFVKDMLIPKCVELMSQGHKEFRFTADPSMGGEVDSDERIYKGAGIPLHLAFTNEFGVRRAVLGRACSDLVEGRPRFLLSPRCKAAKLALAKGYVLKTVGKESHGAVKYQSEPDKNEHSHIGDAIPYAMMGTGEGQDLLKRQDKELEEKLERLKKHKAAAIF